MFHLFVHLFLIKEHFCLTRSLLIPMTSLSFFLSSFFLPISPLLPQLAQTKAAAEAAAREAAERLQRELKSRYPVPPIPQGDSEEDVALRRLFKDFLPPGDLDARIREAEDRAKGQGAAAGK